MLFQLFSIISSALVGIAIIEVGGYFWHRWVEHEGAFGRVFVARHVHHHEVDYPVDKLRPNHAYKSAKSWSWYVMGASAAMLCYVALPRPYSVITIIAALVYAKFVTSYLHKAFHAPPRWLKGSARLQRLTYLHDIHHYKPVNFGITFFFMDRLFGTYSETIPKRAVSTFKA